MKLDEEIYNWLISLQVLKNNEQIKNLEDGKIQLDIE